MALDFLAGCAGGVAGVLVGHPFDTVKVSLSSRFCSQALVEAQTLEGGLQRPGGWTPLSGHHLGSPSKVLPQVLE